MTAKPAVVIDDDFLDAAAREANEHHRDAIDAVSRIWFEHAVMVGEILIKVQNAIPQGEWLQFVKERLSFQQRAANMYMRIAHYKEHLGSGGNPPTFTEAVNRLKYLPVRGRPSPLNAETVESMRQMKADGLSNRAIGKTFGVDHSTVTYWTDKTGFLKKRNQVRQAQSRLYRKQTGENRKQEETDMRKHGGALNETYRLVRRAQTAIAKLENAEEDVNGQRIVANASMHLFRAERGLVEALYFETKQAGDG